MVIHAEHKMDNTKNLKRIEALIHEYDRRATQSGIVKPDGKAENYFNGVVDGLNKAWKILNGCEDEL